MDERLNEELFDDILLLYEQLKDLWKEKGRLLKEIDGIVYISLRECIDNLTDSDKASVIQKLVSAELKHNVENDGDLMIRLRDVSIVLTCSEKGISVDALVGDPSAFDSLVDKLMQWRDASETSPCLDMS